MVHCSLIKIAVALMMFHGGTFSYLDKFKHLETKIKDLLLNDILISIQDSICFLTMVHCNLKKLEMESKSDKLRDTGMEYVICNTEWNFSALWFPIVEVWELK